MNERIRLLAEQAMGTRKHVPPVWQFYDIELEKFAQLIVKECIDCLKPLSKNHSMVGAAQDTIREHFGVKE